MSYVNYKQVGWVRGLDRNYGHYANHYFLSSPIKQMNLPIIFRVSPKNKFKTLDVIPLKSRQNDLSPNRTFYTSHNYTYSNYNGRHKFFGIGDVL